MRLCGTEQMISLADVSAQLQQPSVEFAKHVGLVLLVSFAAAFGTIKSKTPEIDPGNQQAVQLRSQNLLQKSSINSVLLPCLLLAIALLFNKLDEPSALRIMLCTVLILAVFVRVFTSRALLRLPVQVGATLALCIALSNSLAPLLLLPSFISVIRQRKIRAKATKPFPQYCKNDLIGNVVLGALCFCSVLLTKNIILGLFLNIKTPGFLASYKQHLNDLHHLHLLLFEANSTVPKLVMLLEMTNKLLDFYLLNSALYQNYKILRFATLSFLQSLSYFFLLTAEQLPANSIYALVPLLYVKLQNPIYCNPEFYYLVSSQRREH